MRVKLLFFWFWGEIYDRLANVPRPRLIHSTVGGGRPCARIIYQEPKFQGLLKHVEKQTVWVVIVCRSMHEWKCTLK